MSDRPDFSFSLTENAIDSFQHGVEHFLNGDDSAKDLKATIIHVFHAVELFLKAALASVHPSLIYSKIDEGKIQANAHTVSFEKLLWRLQNFDIDLSPDDVKHLKSLQALRNSIEHHQVSGNRAQVEGYVAHAIAFLDSFLPQWLHFDLREIVEAEVYADIRDRAYSHELRQRVANERLERHLPAGEDVLLSPSLVVQCPDCGEEFFWADDPNAPEDRGQCYFCDAQRFVGYCGRCQSPILGSVPWNEDNWPGICYDCMENLMLE